MLLDIAAVLCIVGAVFSFVVWPPFLRRVAADPRAKGADGRRTRFFVVHLVLISTALAIALAQGVTGVLLFLFS